MSSSSYYSSSCYGCSYSNDCWGLDYSYSSGSCSCSSSDSYCSFNDPANGNTNYPVRYHDGQIQMKVGDIGLQEGAVPHVHKRKYDNLKYSTSGVNGFGWKVNEPPRMEHSGCSYLTVFAENDNVRFNKTPNAQGIHAALGDRSDTLQIDNAAKTFIVTRGDGTVWTFSNDPEGLVPQGLPISAIADNGKVTKFVYQNGRLGKVIAYHKDQIDKILAELEYTHDSEGILAAITLRQNNGNVLKPVKRVLYSYYTDEDSYGNAGDLKTVITEMANNDSWISAETYCYRYYKDGDQNGPKHVMKMAFFPADFEFAQKNGINLCSQIPDSAALEYATKYYEYDDKQRVVLERVDRNRKLITIEYTEYPDTDDLNAAHRKTVETGPFGNQNIVFTNKNGKVLLREEVAPPGTDEPSVIYHFRYNAREKRTHKYSGGAVLGYTVVCGQKTTLELDLSSDKGKIEIDEFYDGQDGPLSAFCRKTIQNGTNGTPIVQEEVRYVKFDINGKMKWKPKQNVQFADEYAKSTIATAYQYELFPGTDKMMQKTTTLPVTPKEQNGTGIAATIVERFDEKGHLVWWKDELGIIGYSQYDSQGQQVKTIQDVDTAKTADFTVEVPKGWATIADAGKHLVMEYEYDSQGRLTQILYPENESVDENNNVITARKADWMVYDDARRRTMSASGYVTADGKTVLVNPVSITIHGVGGKVLEEIAVARGNAEGRLLVTDAFPQSSYVSWTKHFYEGRSRTATRVYTTIPKTGDGIQGKNYEETAFMRDEFGRQNQTVAPNGLITRQKQDWRGHTLEVWQGGDESNLVLMTEMVYGGEGACPTCSGLGDNPRVVVQHVDDETTRITENVYDWRGRLIETFGEEDANGQSISTKNFYDNLGRTVKTEQFVNDALESRLIARNESLYTPQSSAWCQTQSAADPKTGELVETKKALTWFDTKGREIKSQSACQCTTNVMTYDSLGRTVKSAMLGKKGEALQETEQVYDNAGHVIQTVSTELSATSTKNFSCKQLSAQWYDPMGRSVADAQFGTNGGKVFRREKKIPDSGLVTRRVYNTETGLASAQIDVAGRTTTFTYDAIRQQVKESHFTPECRNRKLVRETRLQVDTRHGISTQIDSLGNITQNIADIFGRTIAQIDALGGRTEMVYNRAGQFIEQRDPMGRVTKFVYDNLGRRVEVILPKPSSTEKAPVRKTVYNVLGQVIQEIDPLGNTTTMEYDAFGRRAAVIDAEGGRTEFTYDSSGNMLSLIDPVGNVTSYVYDDVGRMIEETNALGKTRKFEYEGNLPVRKTDRNGRVTTFEYNDFGKPVAEKWFSVDGKLIETIAYHFDPFGKLESVVDSSCIHTFEHDELGRNVQTVIQLTGLDMPITFENKLPLYQNLWVNIGSGSLPRARNKAIFSDSSDEKP